MDGQGPSRREFNRRLAAGAGFLFGGKLAPESKRAEAVIFADDLFAGAEKYGGRLFREGFLETEDVGKLTGLPVTGLRHHIQFGRAGDFWRGTGTDYVANGVCELIGSHEHHGRFKSVVWNFFEHERIDPDFPATVMVCPGHVTTRHAFQQQRQTVITPLPRPGDVVRLEGCPKVEFGSWKGYELPFDLGALPFCKPDGRDNLFIVRRNRQRRYMAPEGYRFPDDTIVQYGWSDLGDDLRSIQRGEYYPNSEPFRRQYNHLGYTDVTVVVLVRTVWPNRRRTRRFVQQLSISVNKRNPDEFMDVNTLVRPVDRLFEQYAPQLTALRQAIGGIPA